MNLSSRIINFLLRPVFIIFYTLPIIIFVALCQLNLDLTELVPEQLNTLFNFFYGMLFPALNYEAMWVPPGTEPLIIKVFLALKTTVIYAATSISIAFILGSLLAIFAAESFWKAVNYQKIKYFPWFMARFFSSCIRSIHELLWAVLFLAAFGVNSFSAILAIAVPYSGVFSKVFSEILDEQTSKYFEVYKYSGAGSINSFIFGKVLIALPGIFSYFIYRFECALRSSAILGFFGFPTLGYYISASFENLHYREVWTYIYALLLLVGLFNLLSPRLRCRNCV